MKKKRNKDYNPNKHRRDPLAFDMAIRLVKPVEDDTKARLSLDNHVAVEAFAKAVADKAHFDTLSSTVDVTLLLLNGLFKGSDDLVAEVKQGWHGMVRARERYKTTGRLGLDGEAFTAIKRVCEIYEGVIGNVTGSELLKFYRARDLAIKGGNYFKGSLEEKKAA